MLTDQQFDDLLSIIDRHAGKRHGRAGVVAQGLREVLAAHERMLVTGKWVMPAPPERGTEVTDRHGVVWTRPYNDPGWVDLWDARGYTPQRWHELLGKRGPLTRVK